MKGHSDYPDDQEFVSDLLPKVESLISDLNQLKESVDPNIPFIEELTKEENDISVDAETAVLEEQLCKSNEVLKKLEEAIGQAKEISMQAKDHRVSVQDAFVERNLIAKTAKFEDFKGQLANLKDKMDMVVSRVEKEKEDPALDDYHRGILEEAEGILTEKQPELQELELKVQEDQELIDKITGLIGDQDLTNAHCDQLVKLIELIEGLNVAEVDTIEPIERIYQELDKVIETLNEIDTDQANDVSVKKLKDITLNADKLMQSLKFIKSVFDATDGYTSSEEEDKTYDGISKSLGTLILELRGVIDQIAAYKNIQKFDDIDEFVSKMSTKIINIEKALNKHSSVLQQISWLAKLSHRREELKDEQQDTEDIISDGQKVLEDLKKMQEKASKNPEGNAELLEKIEQYIDTVTESLFNIEEHKNELESINDPIQEFADMIEKRDNTDMKQIIKLLKKNKDIKESIIKVVMAIDALDAIIDDIAIFRDSHIGLIKKKYKPKKGDEIDELLGNLLNNTSQDIDIKRTGEGKYMIGDKKISAKVVNGNLLVRVGGGYMTMEMYMESFGIAQMKRSARRAKRETRRPSKMGHKMRTLRLSGTKKVVGSADLKKSLM